MGQIVNINSIQHQYQRYNTVGDWQYNKDEFRRDVLTINVSSTGDHNYDMLIAIHELIEAVLCKANGITEELVDLFDKTNEDHTEPGLIPSCPYYREHMVASIIERMIADELGIEWNEYGEILENVWKSRS